ncbi:hypothetical protein BZL29_7727 [Mycobacterium kansasii]|uniref:Uncharacterized protein n=1 Tax=Mycobacterium kansasii TaxID=1768 RepID=A0A1V3WEX9_MYCKA|nr:hypothetical protein BZL29_7727 [Mycobacterium kansasii]
MLALVRTLPVPVPWDRNAFIEGVARLRAGRSGWSPRWTSLRSAHAGYG